jgi:DNA repair exonuclease SbcCD ATPase subunit
MDAIGLELYREWGLFGLVIIVCAFIIYDKFFKSKPNKDNTLNELIIDSFDSMKENINDKIDGIDKRIDKMDNRIDKMDTQVNEKFTDLEIKVRDLPTQNVRLFSQRNQEIEEFNSKLHSKAIEDIMKLGPKIYDLLNDFCVKINCTHLFIGSFHNGSTDLLGFPYIKMNIIREAYHPNEMVKEDHPFAPVYKDCDLSLLGKLPSLLVQKKMLYFNVENLESTIFKYDSLIGRRMLGMGIKQIALYGLFEDEKISGFIGCVRYDDTPMAIDELKVCVKELELVHNYSTFKN